MKFRKFAVLLLAMLMAVSLLAACGNSSNTSSAATSSTQTSEPRTVTDMQGNVVEIPDVVEKVSDTGFPAAEALVILLEQEDTLATINDWNTHNEFLAKYYPELMKLDVMPDSSEVNVEDYVTRNVQVVISTNSNYVDQLKELGIATVIVDTSSAEGMMNSVLMLGEMYGGDSYKKAQDYANYYQGNLDRLIAASSGLKDEEKPRVYYAGRGILKTEGSTSSINTWIEACGGINCAKENGIEEYTAEITAEELYSWNPDVIILRDAAYYEEIMNDAELADLPAIKNGKVFVSPSSIYNWATRGAEAAIMPLWAATVISPDLFADIDMDKETRDYHSYYYGMDLTDDEVYTILHPAGV